MYSSASVRYIPNALTVVRILLTPLVLVLCTIPTLAAQGTAVIVFMCASASDYYDGVLARRMGARSRLGQFLDPLADKILVLSVFGMLAIEEPHVVPWWAVLLIAGRDVLVTALRSWAEAHGRTLRTFRVAKGKTLAQLAFLFGMLVIRAATHLPGPVSNGARWLLYETAVPFVLLVLVVGFTVGTGLLYVLAAEEESVRAE
jgi:CDP-diacylglycerol--glycerol-3-phosphate 3-phosphatidyltransferase